MKIVRFQYQDKIEHGIIEGEIVRIVDGSIFKDGLKLSAKSVNLDDIKPLAPVTPSKIICVGLNYKDHAKELNMKLPEEPVLFLKPPSSVIGPYDNIIYPSGVTRLDYEAELAVVIKKEARNIPKEESSSYILGYTCLNDVTARDLQQKDGQWTRAKSFDTFCPIGPYIVNDIDPDKLDIELSVNGQIRQSSNTDNLIFKANFLVSFISHIMTLFPGDIIATGIPKGVGPLSRRDRVELKIGGVGSLTNTVI